MWWGDNAMVVCPSCSSQQDDVTLSYSHDLTGPACGQQYGVWQGRAHKPWPRNRSKWPTHRDGNWQPQPQTSQRSHNWLPCRVSSERTDECGQFQFRELYKARVRNNIHKNPSVFPPKYSPHKLKVSLSFIIKDGIRKFWLWPVRLKSKHLFTVCNRHTLIWSWTQNTI